MKDALAFFVIHSPFLVFIGVLVGQSKGKALTWLVLSFISLLYAITIFASLARLGDGFGYFHYFLMYFLVPMLYFYYRSHKYESFGKCAAVSIFLVFPALAVIGGCALFVAFLLDPPSFK